MQFGKAFAQTLGAQVVQSVASILTGVVIARALGPGGQGLYAIFAAGIAVGSLVASLGQFHSNVLQAADGRSHARTLVIRALLQGTLITVLLWPTSTTWGGIVGLAEVPAVARVFAVVLGLEVIAQLLRGVNLGQHHVGGWNLATVVQRFVFLAVLAVLGVLRRLDLEGVVECWGVGTMASIVVSVLWVWWHTAHTSVTWFGLRSGWLNGLRVGGRAFGTVGLGLLLVRCDVWMLRPMLGVEVVGQMSVATSLAEWLWYIPSILGNLLFAVVAADRSGRSVSQVAQSARVVAALLLLVTVALMMLSRPIVISMYGSAYDEAAVLFLFLLPGTFALGIHLVVDAYFSGRGFPLGISIGGALGALLAKVGLNLLLVPAFGARGAALATSLAYTGLVGFKVLAFSRATGLHPRALLVMQRADVSRAYERLRRAIATTP